MTGHRPPRPDAPDVARVSGGVQGATEVTAASTGDSVRTHVVKKGDTLSTIAEQTYGKAGRWTDIYAANRDVLDDPDCVRPGQILQLPD